MVVRFVGRLFAAIGFLAAAGSAAAQSGRIVGKVTDGAGNAVAAATVQAIEGLRTVAVVSTGEDGTYRVQNLKAGTYGIKITRIGFKPYSKYNIAVASTPVTLNVKLDEMPTQLNTVAITGIAEEEKVNKAPAAINVLNQQTINEQVTATPTDQLRNVPGIDITAGGVVQTNVVARGFNNIFSGSLLTLTDNRFNFVPSLRVNVSYMSTTTNEDIDRIEVVLGPAAALYGPNASQGVMHVITKSPFDSKGGILTVDAGEQSLRRIAGRYAGTFGSKFGYKFSAEQLTATDFPSRDAAEEAAGFHRSFDINRLAMDFRADYRPDTKTEVTLNVGHTKIGSAVEPTGLGAAQIKDWSFNSYQLKVKRGKFFAQYFVNASDAGKTFLLRTGQQMVDKSDQKVAQVQHSFSLGSKQTFVYGADYLQTEPKTGGTINGRNENNDNFTETGGYVHSITHLNKYWDAVGAIRYDKHSSLDKGKWSPRIALVYNPSETQSFRVTYNEAFSNPSTNNQSLDLLAANVPSNAMPWYPVRAEGTPATGFQFKRDCTGGMGGLCMKVPALLGGTAGAWVPAGGAAAYKVAIGVAAAGGLQTSLQNGLIANGVPASLAPALAAGMMQTMAALNPTTQVGAALRVLNPTTGTFADVSAGDVRDIDQIRPTVTAGWEAGWKGQLGKKFYGTIDWWYTERNDFVGPLIVETPNVFVDAASLTSYLTTNLAPVLAPLGSAAAGALAAGFAANIANSVKGLPVGVVNFNSPMTGGSEIALAYRNFGKVKLWGTDFGGTFIVDDNWTIAGTYSYVNKDFFPRAEVGGVSDIALNAPKNKNMVALRYRDDVEGVSGEFRWRRTQGFPGNSGVYVGPVSSYDLTDASLTFRPKFLGGAMLSVVAQNLLNRKHEEFVGGATLGRLVMTRIQYSF